MAHISTCAQRGPKKVMIALQKATVQPGVATLEPPSTSWLLSQSLQTMDDWYKSVWKKKGYANYIKNGKKLLEEWMVEGRKHAEGGLVASRLDSDPDADRSELGQAFDKINKHMLTALHLVMAYKCEHLGQAFATAEGLQLQTNKHGKFLG